MRPRRPRSLFDTLRGAIILGLMASAPAHPAAPDLTLRIVCEPAIAGASAQIKIYASSPRRITSANLSMDLDPSFFGAISNVAAFSADGDAAGYAHVKQTHVDAHFSSGSGGISQLPGQPILTVSAAVLPGLTANASATLNIDTANSSFTDTLGQAYSVTVLPATVQASGSMSVQRIYPAAGVISRGAVVQIIGTGFDPTTTVEIDGVAISSAQFVNAREIDVTIGGTTEMTGKCVRLTNASNERVEFFGSPPSGSGGVHFLLPLQAYQLVNWTYPVAHPEVSESFALQNPTSEPVSVTFFSTSCTLASYTIPPGALTLVDYNTARLAAGGSCTTGGIAGVNATAKLYMIATTPIRMLAYQYIPQLCFTCAVEEMTFPPVAMSGLPPPTVFFLVTPLVWYYQTGQPQPSSLGIGVDFPPGTPVSTLSASVSSSASRWLTATIEGAANSPPQVKLTANATSLPPGTYTGMVTVTVTHPLPTYVSQYPQPSATFPVVLNVSSSAFVIFTPADPGQDARWWQSPAPAYFGPYPVLVPIQSTNGPLSFTTTASTSDGGNWLLVTPSKGTTPASIKVEINPAGLTPGQSTGQYTGQVLVRGPANSVGFFATDQARDPFALSFVLEAGTTGKAHQDAAFHLGSISAPVVETQTGGTWLSAYITDLKNSEVAVTASAAALGPGTYHGTVTVQGSENTASIPVTLTVTPPPATALRVNPASLSLTVPVGQAVTQSFTVNSTDGAAVVFAIMAARIYPVPAVGAGVNPMASLTATPISVAVASTSSYTGSDLGYVYSTDSTPVAPATIQVQASAIQPGTYYGSIDLTWNGGSLTVPVTLTVTPNALFPPLIASVVNAASQSPTALAPGEILSIFGTGIGGAPTGFTPDAKGNLPTDIGGTEVLINGQPAPLLFTSASQINAIVPYEIGVGTTATLQIQANGVRSATWELPTALAAPGIFSYDGGSGQAAVLNQDNSVNGASNPAAAGTTIQIYATGGGQTTPASVTGAFSGNSPANTALPVSATIGGVDAPVTYSGSVPGAVAGLLQVNAIVPATVKPGAAVKVAIKSGGVGSQDGPTIVVK